MDLAVTPRTVVLKSRKRFTDGRRMVSKMWRAHIVLKSVQEFIGLRAAPVQNMALALAPRTFVSKVHNH
eukprot:7987719-Pyramimonas_sp.AAC.1